MSGVGISGIALAIIGILTVVWGATEETVSLTDVDFMSFVTGGFTVSTVGLLMISNLPAQVHVGSIWFTTLVAAVYLVGMPDMDLLVTLMGIVAIAAFSAWLTTKFWN